MKRVILLIIFFGQFFRLNAQSIELKKSISERDKYLSQWFFQQKVDDYAASYMIVEIDSIFQRIGPTTEIGIAYEGEKRDTVYFLRIGKWPLISFDKSISNIRVDRIDIAEGDRFFHPSPRNVIILCPRNFRNCKNNYVILVVDPN